MFRSPEFQERVSRMNCEALAAAVPAVMAGDEAAQADVTAAAAWCAFACPAGVQPLYDKIAATWLGGVDDRLPLTLPQAPVEDALWEEYWSSIDRARTVVYTPATATARVAAISRHTHADFAALAEATVLDRFGPASAPGPALELDVDPELWSSAPDDSLGRAVADEVAAGTYDLDIRGTRERRELPPTVEAVHGHADRLDGVWRTVLGYSSEDSHLIAFAGFQLAQSGHLFSGGALALFCALAHFVIPNTLPILLHLIAEGWRHGREAPPLAPIDWRPHWHEPVAAVREQHRIPQYRSVFSKHLFRALPTYGTHSDAGEPQHTGE